MRWNASIIQCDDTQLLRPISELCHRNHVQHLVVPPTSIELAIMGRSMLRSAYKIVTTITNTSQNRGGSDKLIGAHADIFDADGFEITPITTNNPHVLLRDLRDCSSFLRDNLHQQIIVGWDLSSMKLKDNETWQLFDEIAKGYKPNYIKFSSEQGLLCAIAKNKCAAVTALPYGNDVTSDYTVIDAAQAIKLTKQPIK